LPASDVMHAYYPAPDISVKSLLAELYADNAADAL
jgi:hypothetical protein